MSADGVRRVLQDHVRNYTKDDFSYGMVRWVAGNGLLTSQGDFWTPRAVSRSPSPRR